MFVRFRAKRRTTVLRWRLFDPDVFIRWHFQLKKKRSDPLRVCVSFPVANVRQMVLFEQSQNNKFVKTSRSKSRMIYRCFRFLWNDRTTSSRAGSCLTWTFFFNLYTQCRIKPIGLSYVFDRRSLIRRSTQKNCNYTCTLSVDFVFDGKTDANHPGSKYFVSL